MKGLLVLIKIATLFYAENSAAKPDNMVVNIPYMKRAGLHRIYADSLMRMALNATEDKYGPYLVIQQKNESVIRRQLRDLESGKNLSLAVSMPSPEWLNNTIIINFPIMKGMASYRMFFAHKKHAVTLNNIRSVNNLKTVKIGQGPGWSTGKILEDNGFNVVYGGPYETLIPMLNSERFSLLMRGVYEIEPELKTHSKIMPDLTITDNIAIYTYLPMYFFVSRQHPELAERLTLGLKRIHNSGEASKMFNLYFEEPLQLLKARKRKIFYLKNSNIDGSFFERDKPYLLDTIRKLGEDQPPHRPQRKKPTS